MNLILHEITNLYSNHIGVDIDRVERDFGIREVDFISKTVYLRAVIDWWFNVCVFMPRDRARMYAIHGKRQEDSRRIGITNSREEKYIQRYRDIIILDLNRVSQDYGINPKDYKTRKDYQIAMYGWLSDVWEQMPTEKAENYTSGVPGVSIQHSIRMTKVEGSFDLKDREHGKGNVQNLEQVHGIRSEDYASREEYLQAVSRWMRNIGAMLPRDKAHRFVTYGPMDSEGTDTDMFFDQVKLRFLRNQNIIGIDFKHLECDFGLIRNNFKTRNDYMVAVADWLNKTWRHLPKRTAEWYALGLPGVFFSHNLGHLNSWPKREIEGPPRFFGVHAERVYRDSGLKREEFQSDYEYMTAFHKWRNEVRGFSQKYLLFVK